MFFPLHIPPGRPGISAPDKVEGPRGPGGAVGTAPGANHPRSLQLHPSVHISMCRMFGNSDPAGRLARHSRAQHDNSPLWGGGLGVLGLLGPLLSETFTFPELTTFSVLFGGAAEAERAGKAALLGRASLSVGLGLAPPCSAWGWRLSVIGRRCGSPAAHLQSPPLFKPTWERRPAPGAYFLNLRCGTGVFGSSFPEA